VAEPLPAELAAGTRATARSVGGRTRERQRSRLWPALAAPGVVWLLLLFVVPFYGVMAIAFGKLDPIFGNAVPVWNPLHWEYTSFGDILERVLTAELGRVFVRTFLYVVVALAICFLIGYPVAYYVARLAGRRRGLLLALLLAPFWINYLMRMLAWVNLLQTDGYVNDISAAFGFDRVAWLDGRAITVILGLAYGYVPFLVLPLFAALDRIDPRLLEASRDLGMGPAATFLRVTLPLSRQGMLAAAVITALPMTGDFYTTDLLSGSPRTNMIGNQIEFYLFEGSQKSSGAALVLILSVVLIVAMLYYLRSIDRSARQLA
jgi:ABC-type spermidine/putrescine transport system permease subunit I